MLQRLFFSVQAELDVLIARDTIYYLINSNRFHHCKHRYTHVFVSLTMHLSSNKFGLSIDRLDWKDMGHVCTTLSPWNSEDWAQEVERLFKFQPLGFPAHQLHKLLPLGTGAQSGQVTFAFKFIKLWTDTAFHCLTLRRRIKNWRCQASDTTGV